MTSTAVVAEAPKTITPFYQHHESGLFDLCRVKNGAVFAIFCKAMTFADIQFTPKFEGVPVNCIFLAPMKTTTGSISLEGRTLLFFDKITTGKDLTLSGEPFVFIDKAHRQIDVPGLWKPIGALHSFGVSPAQHTKMVLAFLKAAQEKSTDQVEAALHLFLESHQLAIGESLAPVHKAWGIEDHTSYKALEAPAIAASAGAAAESKGDAKAQEKKEENPKKA
ncbi:MAG: hypothetical protein HYX48_02230 [Chlamydiales bacterium]|nr:hypothetical protein [Chlamydiales bacterium]